jgi:long-chain acyl-CoA synthetase
MILMCYDNNRDISLNGSDDFVRLPFEGVDTLLKAFKRTVNKSGGSQFLGTRDPNQEGRPYVWRSFNDTD